VVSGWARVGRRIWMVGARDGITATSWGRLRGMVVAPMGVLRVGEDQDPDKGWPVASTVDQSAVEQSRVVGSERAECVSR